MVRRGKLKRLAWQGVVYTGVFLLVVWLLAPFLWTALTSFQPYERLTAVPPRVSFSSVELANYKFLFSSPQFQRALKNSAIVICSSTLLSMLLAALGAYAVGTLRFRGQTVLLLALLSIQLAPALALLIPLYMLLRQLRLVDTYPGLLITFLLFQAPVAVWILRGFFSAIPREIFEAARVDGCSRWNALIKIALPLARPGILAVGIYTFITGWGDLLIPLTVSIYKWQMLTVYASGFGGLYNIDYGGATAVAVISAIPSVIIALVFRKQLIRGLTAGAIKG